MFDSSLLYISWGRNSEVATSLRAPQPWKQAPILPCLGPCTVISHLDFGVGKQASEHPWGTGRMGVQGKMLPSIPFLTGLSSFSSDGKNPTAKLRKQTNTGTGSPNPTPGSVAQLWPSRPCCPVTQCHQALWHHGLLADPTPPPRPPPPMAQTTLDSHYLQTSPSSCNFTCRFSAATG